MEFSGLIRITSAIVFLGCLQSCCSQTVASCKLGQCVDIMSCPVLWPAINLYVRSGPHSKEIIDIIKPHRCGDSESKSICCTDLEADLVANNILSNFTNENSTLVLSELIKTPCGISDGSDRIVNGVRAFLFEFPWMALLEYNTTEGNRFLCAGSLISDRYVLTAAHCFMSSNAQLVNVRLGEYNTSQEIDCEGEDHLRECAPPVQNHQVEDVIIHEDFNAGQFLNDIALIRLKDKVVYGDRILPICLPILKIVLRNVQVATVAGWGYTVSGNTSDVLQKADLPVLSNDFCEKMFGRTLFSSQICAGGRKGIDTCKGDSGGPLFTRGGTFYRFVQYGILSGGGQVCGGNNTVPSIYTNVVEFVPWIIKNMLP